MLHNIKIINADFGASEKNPGLKRNFPKGLLLETHPDINLVVGPNGWGKTALLRMLATSLDCSRYYDKNGISNALDYSFGRDENLRPILTSLRNEEPIDGLVRFGSFGKEYEKFKKLCEEHGINYTVKQIENPNPGTQGMTISVITPAEKLEILRLEELLRKPSDDNIWRFIKPNIGGAGRIYHADFEFPLDHDSYIEGKEGIQFMDFDTDQSRHSIARDYGVESRSPGHRLYNKLLAFLEKDVPEFFEHHLIPMRRQQKDHSPQARMSNAFKFGYTYRKLRVPSDSRLCIFMDEPTTFLDPVNAFRVQEKILGMIERYRTKVQLFIATNDYAFIEGFKGKCGYINLYEEPAKSSNDFDPKKYVNQAKPEPYAPQRGEFVDEKKDGFVRVEITDDD